MGKELSGQQRTTLLDARLGDSADGSRTVTSRRRAPGGSGRSGCSGGDAGRFGQAATYAPGRVWPNPGPTSPPISGEQYTRPWSESPWSPPPASCGSLAPGGKSPRSGSRSPFFSSYFRALSRRGAIAYPFAEQLAYGETVDPHWIASAAWKMSPAVILAYVSRFRADNDRLLKLLDHPSHAVVSGVALVRGQHGGANCPRGEGARGLLGIADRSPGGQIWNWTICSLRLSRSAGNRWPLLSPQ